MNFKANLPPQAACEHCEGSGVEPGMAKLCRVCGGTGMKPDDCPSVHKGQEEQEGR
jgi:DnaJ-class molecular chaperone